MKLTKQSNKIKSRIVSFAALIALLLCAVLSLGYILPGRIARAEDEPSAPAAKVTDGIRFVQVAAGYDFAIGLTYDHKLYGWSTKEARNTQNMQSLGDYYTYDPTEINVTFRMGASVSSYRWGTTAGSATYHTPRTDDRIKSIAATGTTAAFVTEKGFLYTWGVDTDAKHDVDHYEGKTNYLLLRSTTPEAGIDCYWYTPYIIDYYYYGEDTGSDSNAVNKYSTEQLIPDGYGDVTKSSLAAGEYNYIFVFSRHYNSSAPGYPNTTGNMYHTFVWGSGLYNAVNRVPGAKVSYSDSRIEIVANGRKIFNTFISEDSSGIVTAVAGGYTVGINNTAASVSGGTSLQLHGKNFITTQDVTPSGSNYTVQNIAKLTTEANNSANIEWNGAEYLNAIAGNNGNGQQNGSLYGADTEKYYARQAGSYTYNISGSEAGFIINSKTEGTGNDNKIESYVNGVDDDDNPIIVTALKPTRYAVALGNDIGYGIYRNKLYGWGDNANGQLTGVTGSKDDPTPLLESVSFTSVAAGKQKSPETKGVRAFFNNTATLNGNTFATDVQNDDKYITGALTADGDIYAWSRNITAKPLSYMNVGGTYKKEKFAAVYSGYGEILYAVTESGKLVRITVNEAGNDFDQYVYDKFYTLNDQGAPVEIDNWKVDKTNKVVFNVPTLADDASAAQKVSPYLGNATFYVWSATALTKGAENADVESEYIRINGGAKTAYKPLVSENKIGDAYRIITANYAAHNYLKADNLVDCAPKFYFDSRDDGTGGSLMSPEQQSNMFTFRDVYGENGEGVGIYIEPKQSSKGKNIRVDFYIARYNSYGKYSGNREDDTGDDPDDDNAIYYDYKQCSIIFSIADTPSVVTYSAYNAANGNKSNIPLLDPNNPYNTNYSIAVQDVSTGVDELIKFITGDRTSVNPNFKTAIMTEMKKDKGFPDKDKIAAGDLTYYLNDEDLKKYNNDKTDPNSYAYQWMFTDRDSDRIEIVNRGADGDDPIMNGQGVDGKIETITVKVEYLPSNYGISGDKADLTADNFGAKLLKTIAADFDNRFGLYEFRYTTEDGKNYLSFKYDVLTFTATDATGVLAYEGNTSAAAKVTGYNTVANQPRAGASFISYTLNKYTYTDAAGYVESDRDRDTPRSNITNIAFVYSQPTLRLKRDLVAGTVTDKNGQAGGSKNTYTENRTAALYVGDTATIRLSDYVANIETAGVISFSFENKTSTDDLNKFSGQFKDYTGHNMPVVTLTGNSIAVHPTTAAPISFTVEVQRFVNSDKTRYFMDADNRVDEKIYLTFNFTNIVGFNLSVPDQVKTEYLITDTITIDLFGESNGVNNAGRPFIDIVGANGGSLKNTAAAANAYTALKSNAQIYGLSTSEEGKSESERLFTCTNPQNATDKTQFTITPLRSGSGTILFSTNIYDKSQSFVLTINVSAVTELGDNNKITIIDDQYITVSELDEALRSANSFNEDVINGKYRILFNTDESNAVYFMDADGNTGKPPFIDKVLFESKSTDPTIRLVSSNSTTQQSQVYYMYVRYTNADTSVTTYEDAPLGSIIQIVVPVVSGKIKLQDKDKGGDLVATIDCRNPGKNNWWKTEGERLETRVTIDLQYLLDLDKTEAPDRYKIFLVSADSAATTYFQYDKGAGDRSIEITPKLNTNKNYELNVSVYKEGENTTKVLSFEISIKGILTTLPVMTNDDGIIGYGNIWLYSLAIVFGVLFIIFMIRFIVYMRRRAKQRAIIKRNQELIRLRDRMHGKANAASREQLVKSKLKMEDPKYAKMFNDMRRDKEEESGVALVNSDLAATADKKSKKKKKKGGKKSVAELKAELEAKKAAFAAAQAGNAQPVNPFATEVPLDGDGFVAPDGGFGTDGGYAADAGYAQDGGYAPNEGGFAPDGDFGAQSIDGSEIIFDASDLGDGNM